MSTKEMSTKEWMDWLKSLPDKELEGFQNAAHEWARRYAKEQGDIEAESCLVTFFGDNPQEWMEEAYETIACTCKPEEETRELLKALYDDVTLSLAQ